MEQMSSGEHVHVGCRWDSEWWLCVSGEVEWWLCVSVRWVVAVCKCEVEWWLCVSVRWSGGCV